MGGFSRVLRPRKKHPFYKISRTVSTSPSTLNLTLFSPKSSVYTRPAYQHDPERVYGMEFAGLEVHFQVDGSTLTVTGIDRR